MRTLILASLMLAISTSSIVAAPVFHPYETRGPLIKEGQGGERVTVDGVDIWKQGDPPRRYQILGTITDKRCDCDSLFGKIISALDGDIAKTTKVAGGDAAILDSASNNISDAYSRVTPSGRVQTFTDEDRNSRFFVVKYLPDAPAAPERQ